ncbi:MAG: methyltransferase domain-containing protein, partial [Sediminibacterium sp.]
KYDAKDVTFTIPVSFDHNDRKQNLELSCCMIQKMFETNIFIGEQGGESFSYMNQWTNYFHFDEKEFHRTKMLNDMALAAKTPIVVNWDADMICPDTQLVMAMETLRRNESDMVYPYDGRFARVPRQWFTKMEQVLDVSIMLATVFKGTRPGEKLSVGGAIFFNKQKFIEGGMENEKMISYGPEDVERSERFVRVGLRMTRMKGQIFHMDHWCGTDSSNKNKYFDANWAELRKIQAMTDEQLLSYISEWEWVKPYTGAYYDTFSEAAVKSRDAVLPVLMELYGDKIETVLDCGCGVGEWGFEMWKKFGIDYLGVDYNIPKDKLVIDEQQYLNHDLGTPLLLGRKFDVVFCLEVAEHLQEKYAGVLIENLCNAGEVILFSAAIPHQGGVHHVNEQWQSYWAELFEKRGFYPDTQIRYKLMDNENVELWYRQNIIVFTKQPTVSNPIDFVHPKMYERAVASAKMKAQTSN